MYCCLCQEDYAGVFKTHCITCEKIKRILNLYSKEKILEILEKVCLRKSEKLQEYKIAESKKQLETIEEEIEIQEKTEKFKEESQRLNQSVMEDLKKKLTHIKRGT
tara:strand:- start:3929 stop:4246 length:318 start_codon:yes stop_codon:yes gene_type:complete